VRVSDPTQADLSEAIDKLSRALRFDEVTGIVRKAARELSGADGVTFVVRDGDRCYYADESAIEPLWKGKRFVASKCISGWVMANRQAVAIPDIYADPRIPHEAYRPTFVKSMAMVPVHDPDPIAAIGAYWAEPHAPTERELSILKVLADASARALGRSSTRPR
jgi:GAF domain-containing protein